MNTLLKTATLSLCAFGILVSTTPTSYADSHITGKTVVAGALSLLIWPGIGQAVNKDEGDKVATHAVIGLFPPFRFWSGYDALVNRKGGYWKGRI